MSRWRRLFLPVIGRHLRREFLRTFGLTMIAFVAIYVVADFFDRFDSILRRDVAATTVIWAFLLKIPLIVTQVTPVAVLAGGLIGLGLLARHNEFVALRACGVSTWQVLVPLLTLAAVISGATFAWNETVVPASAQRWRRIWDTEIRGRKAGGISVYAGREVWYHGKAGFYSINRIGVRRQRLLGLTVYQLDRDFRPVRQIQAASAQWDGARWVLAEPRTREFREDALHEFAGTPEGFVLPETLDDFRVVSVEPEEYSYRMLRRQIASLRQKGVDASESWVDLYLKVALPAASIILMLVAVPLAARGTRVTSLPAAAALGFTLGFGYFIVLGFARALGQSGALPPLAAAWSANALFAMIGCYYLLGSD